MLNFSHVSTPAASALSKSRTETAARVGWTLLTVATLYVCYFRNLGAIGFVGPDEPRYAWVAREMAESGDWVTPRLYGKPWFEKPPLLYWGAALGFKFFGVSEAAARLPSAISALLATLAMAWLAWRIYGPKTARWLLLLLPTTVGMIGFSHACATDMPFCAMLTIAMVVAAVLLRLIPTPSGPSNSFTSFTSFTSSTFASLFFGFFLALAVLAKGPAAIILCGGAIFCWALFTKRWRDTLCLLRPAGIAAFCVTALPWYILCAGRNPEFLRIFIIEHNFKRFLTPEFQHIQPWWFYAPVLLAAFLPWTLGFLGLVKVRARGEQFNTGRARTIFFLSFGLFPVLFFTASQSKLPGYILPSVPPLALLLAWQVADRLQGTNTSKRFIAILPALGSLGLGLVAFWFSANRATGQDIRPAPWTVNVWLPLVGAAILAAILIIRRRYTLPVIVVQLGILLAISELAQGLVWVDSQWSARGVVKQTFRSISTTPANEIFLFELPRGIKYGLNFYLKRELPEWTPARNAELVLTSPKGMQTLRNSGFSCQEYLVYPAAIPCQRSPASGNGKPQ